MRDVRITVLKSTFDEELAKAYANPALGVCPFHKPGQEFLSKAGTQPEGLCDEAWTAFGKYAFALAHGSDGFWPGWIEKRNVAINSCNDGLRPVIFKLEAVEQIP